MCAEPLMARRYCHQRKHGGLSEGISLNGFVLMPVVNESRPNPYLSDRSVAGTIFPRFAAMFAYRPSRHFAALQNLVASLFLRLAAIDNP
jgi:hypothetical protein